MSANLYFTGANGSIIDLFNNDYFFISHADGLTAISANIATSTTPSIDGDNVNNIQAQPRGIVLDLQIKDNADVETAKRYILRTVKPKQRGTLRMIYNDRDIEITGVVESVAMPRFAKGITMQVSLYCSQPYWRDTEEIVLLISRIIDAHYFPTDAGGLALPEEGVIFGELDTSMTKTYTNDGDADCGMVISIIALAEVTNPGIAKSDGSFIGVIDTLTAGDEVIINTNRGEKTIRKNGANIISKIQPGSTFFQLETGDNDLTIYSDEGESNMYFSVSFRRRFV